MQSRSAGDSRSFVPSLAAVAVGIWALLGDGGGTGSGLLRADPAGFSGGPEEIIFAVRQPGTDRHYYANFGYFAFDSDRKAYGEGGRLCRLDRRTGRITVLLDDPRGSVRDPQVHYDGEMVLFSYRRGGTPYYHLHEIRADGSDLRRLTDGPWDDIEPSYLPDGGIAARPAERASKGGARRFPEPGRPKVRVLSGMPLPSWDSSRTEGDRAVGLDRDRAQDPRSTAVRVLDASLDGNAAGASGRRTAPEEEEPEKMDGIAEIQPGVAVGVEEGQVPATVRRSVAAGQPRGGAEEEESEEAHGIGDVEPPVAGAVAGPALPGGNGRHPDDGGVGETLHPVVAHDQGDLVLPLDVGAEAGPRRSWLEDLRGRPGRGGGDRPVVGQRGAVGVPRGGSPA